ncbi:hypothetical protein IMX26_10385 [Clostridium sp. 'deep sea']|uniref:hypothetical protein n=1 Tax=Clostridium sp. 'deep sea' TaxID=2779445 RepID=UPI0018966BF4|nr:hypothetical protein [Clostridium sp. 'deep sea']QOR33899.1 hypothetical protein IMX26_10385 [Clostridium sp. 'deep sea']
MLKDENRLTERELVKFFLPIVAMTMLLVLSQNVISSALAQTLAPAIALSAFSVGRGVAGIVQAPCWALMKLTTASARYKKSAKNLLKVAVKGGALVIAVMLFISYTSLNRFIFIDLIGIKENILTETLQVFKTLMLMPVILVLRITHQSFVALRKKTIWLTVGTMARVVIMLGLAYLISKTKFLTGGKIGSIILLTGFAIEAIVAFFKGRPWLKEAPEESETNQQVLSTKNIWRIFYPLIFAQLIISSINSVISAGLSRALNPTIAISSYFVAHTLAWIFIGMGFRVHQLVIVYVKDQNSYKVVKKFVYKIAITMVVLLAILSFTPLGSWVLTNMLNINAEITAQAAKVLKYFVIIPFALFVSEFYQGLMLKERSSTGITICKIVNLTSLAVVLTTLVVLFPNLGSSIGGISIACSYIAEAVTAFLLSKKYLKIKSINLY